MEEVLNSYGLGKILLFMQVFVKGIKKNLKNFDLRKNSENNENNESRRVKIDEQVNLIIPYFDR